MAEEKKQGLSKMEKENFSKADIINELNKQMPEFKKFRFVSRLSNKEIILNGANGHEISCDTGSKSLHEVVRKLKPLIKNIIDDYRANIKFGHNPKKTN